MKKINISLILSLALLISFVLVGALINKVIAVTTNDVFYFSMETAANHNEITQENEGTIIGTPQLIQRNAGKAMSLNGSSGLTLDTIDLSGDFTIELDFMRESVPSDYETLISKCDYGTSREWWLGVARVNSSQMSIKLNIRNSNTTQWNGIGANITIGEYHSVKIVASERIVWLYVDNICKGSMDFVRDNTNTPICIGHTLRNGSSLQYFKGVIDEIKLSMSNNNKDSLAEKLNNNQILRYSFENSTTNTITDTSGNNHNATLSTNLIDISETSSKITNGINDYGMYFNGSQMITTDYILNPKRNLTVSVYFKVNEFTSTEQIIFGQANYANGIRDFTVYVTKGKLLKINIKKATQSTSDGWLTATVSEIEANKWYNLTFTIENDILTSYINGFESKQLNISNLSYSGETPITIGGLYSGNNITQPFKGYVDDFVIYSKVLSSDEIFESLSNNLTNKQKRDVVEISGDTLYDNLEMLDQTQFISISKSDLNAYKWQHGGAIAYYKNKFYATWGRNIGEENTVGEEAACFVSEDGINWTYNASFIAETGYGYSHGSIFEVNGKLYSMYPHYSGSTYGTVGSNIKFNNLEMHGFILNDDETWSKLNFSLKDFWPLQQAVKMENGNYIMGGIDGEWRAAVAISNGSNMTDWKVVKIPYFGTIFTECTVTVEDSKITVYMRNEGAYNNEKVTIGIAYSYDCGETWTIAQESDLSANTSKPCVGILSNGQKYLITNSVRGANTSRNTLTIALTDKNSDIFSQLYVIRDMAIPNALKETYYELELNTSLSYPYAIEKDNKLYVIYSSYMYPGTNLNNIELAIIDLNELTAINTANEFIKQNQSINTINDLEQIKTIYNSYITLNDIVKQKLQKYGFEGKILNAYDKVLYSENQTITNNIVTQIQTIINDTDVSNITDQIALAKELYNSLTSAQKALIAYETLLKIEAFIKI